MSPAEVLGTYRDRCIRAMTDVRSLRYVGDEAAELLDEVVQAEIARAVTDAVDLLAETLGFIQAALDRAWTPDGGAEAP